MLGAATLLEERLSKRLFAVALLAWVPAGVAVDAARVQALGCYVALVYRRAEALGAGGSEELFPFPG